MDKFATRLIKREEGIRDWLNKNNLGPLLKKADQILDSLPRKEIKKEFQDEIKRALKYCAKKGEINALDYEWYYGGSEIGGAHAYGFDSCVTKGSLSKTDLGPDELPGIELKLEHGNLIDEYFSEIPIHHAINSMVNKMVPI